MGKYGRVTRVPWHKINGHCCQLKEMYVCNAMFAMLIAAMICKLQQLY